MSRVAEKADPKLWAEIKAKYMKLESYGGVGWNARKAQAATREYKRRGGTYLGPKPNKKNNNLAKWTAEDWGYLNDSQNTRYLPKAVRESLTPAEKATETRLKRNKKGQHVPYSASVLEKFRNLKM